MSLHLIEPDSLSADDVGYIFALADSIEKEPSSFKSWLCGRSVFVVFNESSTRTRMSFDVASRRLGAEVFHFYPQYSSLSKGETFEDTLLNIVHLGADFLIVRHSENSFFDKFLPYIPSNVRVISGGHGSRNHPTQGLLDVFCIRRYNRKFDGLSVLIVGDVLHSRVARSQIRILKTMGCNDIRVVGPTAFFPDAQSDDLFSSVSFFTSLDKSILDVDVVSILRIQRERLLTEESVDWNDYISNYRFSRSHADKLKKSAIIIHPQPLNRDVEVSSDVVSLPCCKIFEQVGIGVTIRMSCLMWLLRE